MDTHFVNCISKTEIQPQIKLMGYGRKKKKEWIPSDCHCNQYGECDCANCYVCDECFVPNDCHCNRYGECDCSNCMVCTDCRDSDCDCELDCDCDCDYDC